MPASGARFWPNCGRHLEDEVALLGGAHPVRSSASGSIGRVRRAERGAGTPRFAYPNGG
jgi:hypothetical protein